MARPAWTQWEHRDPQTKACYDAQITPPRLGECRYAIGHLSSGIAIFHFDNAACEPSAFILLPRPE